MLKTFRTNNDFKSLKLIASDQILDLSIVGFARGICSYAVTLIAMASDYAQVYMVNNSIFTERPLVIVLTTLVLIISIDYTPNILALLKVRTENTQDNTLRKKLKGDFYFVLGYIVFAFTIYFVMRINNASDLFSSTSAVIVSLNDSVSNQVTTKQYIDCIVTGFYPVLTTVLTYVIALLAERQRPALNKEKKIKNKYKMLREKAIKENQIFVLQGLADNRNRFEETEYQLALNKNECDSRFIKSLADQAILEKNKTPSAAFDYSIKKI